MAVYWRRHNRGNRRGWRKAYTRSLQDPETLDRLIADLEAEYERLPHKRDPQNKDNDRPCGTQPRNPGA